MTVFLLALLAQTMPETTGPYKVVMELDPSLPNHTIYRPEQLARVKGKLPVVTFGNGGCQNAGNAFREYLSEIASHGFLVTANGPIVAEPPRVPGRPAPPGAAASPAPGGPRPLTQPSTTG